MPLLVVGTSHQTAPLAIRETLAFASSEYARKVQELVAMDGVDEAIVLSTCNRTEIYAIVLPGEELTIRNWLQNTARLSDEQCAEFIYTRKDAHAVEHLFNVASGLDSLVLGEPQIVGQLKEAWQIAIECGGGGKLVDRLFQHAFSASKAVRHETGINEHPVSVAYITMVLARQIFGDLSSKKVLLVGAGEMIELCGRHFHQQGVAELIIVNRSLEKAQRLAEAFKASAIGLEFINDTLPEADIVISSTASRTPVISRAAVKNALKIRRRKPMFLVDIAVPRDIEVTVETLDDAYLYTIDDLQQVADENTEQRNVAAKEASGLIQASVEEYMRWLHGARAAKFLKRLRTHAERSSDELVNKALKQIDSGNDPADVVRQLAASLTKRILHVPSIRLRQAAESQEYGILKAADWLFEHRDDKDVDKEEPDQ
jgi:glutamyl-tRNA reductase